MVKWLADSPIAVVLILALGLVSASGCNKKKPEESTVVSGRVLYNNVPIEYGIVEFCTDAGIVEGSAIGRNGFYRVANLPEGEVRICVIAETFNVGRMRERKRKGEQVEEPTPTEKSRLMDKLTEKYSKAETTPLRFTVQGGQQKYDIVLSLP